MLSEAGREKETVIPGLRAFQVYLCNANTNPRSLFAPGVSFTGDSF